jgi:hypothetical protein
MVKLVQSRVGTMGANPEVTAWLCLQVTTRILKNNVTFLLIVLGQFLSFIKMI